jgi:hypothetical protein
LFIKNPEKQEVIIVKKLLLLIIGLLPFAVGYGINALMLGPYYDVALPYGWIGVGMLAVWFVLGALTRRLGGTAFQSALIAHIPALIVLVLLLYQEWILGQYWLNIFGLVTQLFFLPLINIAGMLAFFAHTLPVVYIVAFLLMFAVFWLGARLRRTQKQQA